MHMSMNGLTAALFAEFCGLALVVPVLAAMLRRSAAKLLLPLSLPLLFTVLLLVISGIYLPDEPQLGLCRLQLAACAFALGLAGVTVLLSRLWRRGAPAATTVLALAVLASPFWGNLLLDLASESVRGVTMAIVVSANPLFTIAQETQFDWTHGNVLYHMTRLGEDLAYTPSSLHWVSLGYAALGLVAAGLAGLIRPGGRPADFSLDAAHF